MRAQRLDDLRPTVMTGIERIFRVLQDHGDALAAQLAPFAGGGLEQVDAVEIEPFGRDLAVAASAP
jgi:hypothetical protein